MSNQSNFPESLFSEYKDNEFTIDQAKDLLNYLFLQYFTSLDYIEKNDDDHRRRLNLLHNNLTGVLNYAAQQNEAA